MAPGDAWVVVGLDNGGTKNNATRARRLGTLPGRGADRDPEPREGRPRGGARGARARVRGRAGAHHHLSRARAVGGARHARARERQRGDLLARLHELRPPGLAQLRLPRRARGAPEAARRLQQRRQRRGALRALPAVRPARPPARLDLGGDRHRLRRRRHREGPGDQGRRRLRRRARPRAHSAPRAARARPAAAAVQLRLRGRRREHRLAHRDREEPAAVLADALPRPRAAQGRVGRQGRQAGARLRRGGRPAWRSPIFEQQAKAVGRLFTIAANFTDPDAYFLGGGVVEAAPHFREWFIAKVREHTQLKEEQARASRLEVVPDLDMAGARGAAIAALETVHGR